MFKNVLQYSACLLAWFLCTSFGASVRAQSSTVRAFPSEIQLDGARANAQVIFQRSSGDGQVVGQQVVEGLNVLVADSAIAQYKDGRVFALRDGSTELKVTVGGEGSDKPSSTISVPIVVKNSEGPRTWEFDAHVQAVLTRANCNSGACHGALAGKGGFRLSLRGYDSVSDHFNITRQDRGRRIDALQPGRSLLLAKPLD